MPHACSTALSQDSRALASQSRRCACDRESSRHSRSPSDANRYLDQTAPWQAVKSDRQAAARSLYTALSVIAALRTALAPYLPFSCQRLHEMLNADGSIDELGWQVHALRPGDPLQQPVPLFKKLDPSIVEEEESRLGT